MYPLSGYHWSVLLFYRYVLLISLRLTQITFEGSISVVNNKTCSVLNLSWLEEAQYLGFDVETDHGWNVTKLSQPPATLQVNWMPNPHNSSALMMWT